MRLRGAVTSRKCCYHAGGEWMPTSPYYCNDGATLAQFVLPHSPVYATRTPRDEAQAALV
jgi:hypothetical protein